MAPPPEDRPASRASQPGGETAGRDAQVATARGGLVVAAAKGYFLASGLVQQIALKAVLGLDGYGALSSALSAASIAYNPMVSASLQGVSHAVATADAGERERGAALRHTVRVHAALALAFGISFALLAPTVSRLIGAPHVVGALRLLGGVLLSYGLYAPLVGALNGARRFTTQAAFDVLAATLRTLGLVGGAFWLGGATWLPVVGNRVEGAALGFALSAGVVLLVAAARVGSGRRSASYRSVRAYLRYVSPIFAGQLLLNLLFQADALLLRRFSAEAARAANLDVTAADPLIGAYRAAQLFCFLPYQLVLSIGLVLFPLLAAAHRAGRHTDVARYAEQGTRTALLVSGLLVSVTAGLPHELIALVFGDETAHLGAGAMTLLAPGLGTLALLGMLGAVLNALEAPRQSAWVTALAVALVGGICFATVRGQAFGRALLSSTALATSIGLASATLVAAWLVRRRAGAVVRPLSVLRILASLGVAVGVARMLPRGAPLATVLYALLVATCYLATLIGSRELGRRDLDFIRQALGRRRGRPDAES